MKYVQMQIEKWSCSDPASVWSFTEKIPVSVSNFAAPIYSLKAEFKHKPNVQLKSKKRKPNLNDVILSLNVLAAGGRVGESNKLAELYRWRLLSGLLRSSGTHTHTHETGRHTAEHMLTVAPLRK